ncbi:hypothetical protein G9X67_15005 [Rhizobium sp. WYCCWR 11152]|uniref:hypothetical protein n=1 Tax=Rhizobium sp. WYCCWR 11152 TaxID=2692316 RepID=UPI00149245C2|nr:hypothetical protein [Rhizobium sp. WYCCWR 11152]NNU66580.1 hypothetical protein [Rhizobium sp. WYCCWR 11152]
MPAPVAAVEVAKPATTIWVGGHYGEFDWHPFNGATKRDVIRQLLEYHGHGNDEEIALTMTMTDEELDKELKSMEMDVERAKSMDGLQPDEVKPYHWIKAGLGASCDRCNSECYEPDGAVVISFQAVCEECITLADKLELGWNDEVEEQLTDIMVDNDCHEADVREILGREMYVDLIPGEMWAKCLAEARAAL